MNGQIDGNLKDERSQKLIELSDNNQEEYNEQYIGEEVQVLFEEKKNGYYQGHTKNYILAICKTNANLENKLVKVRCIGIFGNNIKVEVINVI